MVAFKRRYLWLTRMRCTTLIAIIVVLFLVRTILLSHSQCRRGLPCDNATAVDKNVRGNLTSEIILSVEELTKAATTTAPAYMQIGSEDFAFPLQINMLELADQHRRGNVGHSYPQPINKPSFAYLHENADLCHRRGEATAAVFLLLLIKSAPKNALARGVIRETWGNESCWGGEVVRRVFLFGRAPNPAQQALIHTEATLYGDVVQVDYIDHYYNNTYKMMSGFRWATTHCAGARFVYFVDDDFFVSPANAVAFVRSVTPAQWPRFIAGYVWRSVAPVRSKLFPRTRKWVVSWAEYPWHTYPPYCAGGSFMVSMRVAEDIALAMGYTRFFSFDDVFLGLVCHKLLLVPIHTARMYSFHPVKPPDPALKITIASHGYKDSATMIRA